MNYFNELAPHYLALILAAYKGYPSDIALDLVETGSISIRGQGNDATQEMIRLLGEGYKLREVAQMFGYSVSGVNSRVRRYRERMGER